MIQIQIQILLLLLIIIVTITIIVITRTMQSGHSRTEACGARRGNSQGLAKSSPCAGPSAGAEVVCCLRKWRVWCLRAQSNPYPCQKKLYKQLSLCTPMCSETQVLRTAFKRGGGYCWLRYCCRGGDGGFQPHPPPFRVLGVGMDITRQTFIHHNQ